MKSVISIIISLDCIAVQLFLFWKISRKAKAWKSSGKALEKILKEERN
jgi:hypothetical protein